MLDGLRGVAALAVVAFHASLMVGFQQNLPYHGTLAVDFFFMLSGLVVANAYEERLRTHRIQFLEFVKIRLIRLYPMIALGTLLGALSMLGHVHHLRATGGLDPHTNATYPALVISLVLGLLILPFGPLGPTLMPLDTPLWSIFYELFINFVYAGIVRFLTRSVLGIVVIFSSITFIAVAIYAGDAGIGIMDSEFFMGFARVSASFFIGVTLHRLYRRGALDGMPGVPFFALTIVLLASFFVPKYHGDVIFCLACIFLLYPLIIIGGLSDTVADRWRPAISMSGRLSYPVYALHKPIIDHLTFLHRFHGVARIGALAGSVAIVVIISYAATLAYDEPVRRRLGTRIRRTAAPIIS